MEDDLIDDSGFELGMPTRHAYRLVLLERLQERLPRRRLERALE